MLLLIMHFIADEEDPYGIVTTFVDALPSGSYLVLSHTANDNIFAEQVDEAVTHLNQSPVNTKLVLRHHPDILRFFDSLELLEPGLVYPHQWRPEPGADLTLVPMWVGVARKP
jgi:hypothetical protein